MVIIKVRDNHAVEYRLTYIQEQSTHTCCSTDRQKHDTKWKESPQRPHIVCFYLYEMHRTGTSIEITHQQLSRLAELRKKWKWKGNSYGISFLWWWKRSKFDWVMQEEIMTIPAIIKLYTLKGLTVGCSYFTKKLVLKNIASLQSNALPWAIIKN